MEIYIVRSTDPLDHEGSADVVAVFLDESLAKEAVDKLKAVEEETCRKTWGERWQSFSKYYEVEPWTIDTDPQAVVAELYKEEG